VLGKHFEAPNPLNTRAILVAHGGKIIYEQYALPNFGPDTTHLGWSMTKSITNALIGHRVLEGKMSLKDPISKYVLRKILNDL
jgi:CubicO group peptidase (beta-lactamase class C family)